MSEQSLHVSVLLKESIKVLVTNPDGIYIDGTFGRGGHSRAILSQLSEKGCLYGIDRDPEAITAAKTIQDPRFHMISGEFSRLEHYMQERDLLGQVDGILLDLGVSSPQLDDADRGFSFLRDGPLDMRMNPNLGISAKEWLLTAEAHEISHVLRAYGEERFAGRIARKIITHRENEQHTPLETTRQLASLIESAVPKTKEKHKHPATRSFQAIRIHINQELEEIELALQGTLSVLSESGRLAVISFHSLEDRIIKRFIREQSKGPSVPSKIPLTEAQLSQLGKATLQPLSKAIKPSAEEIAHNPRSRSAVLRAAKRVNVHG